MIIIAFMDHADRIIGFLNKNRYTNVMTYDYRHARGFDNKKQALLFASMMKIEYYRRPINRNFFRGTPAFVRVLSSPRLDGNVGFDYVGDKQYGWTDLTEEELQEEENHLLELRRKRNLR